MISVELLDARREQRFVGDGQERGERDEGERHLNRSRANETLCEPTSS
jgi:hypothetical protein